VLALLAQAKVAPKELAFVASHGQTIWHEPGRATFQLGDAAVLAERLGVRVVSDFRARDVAAGGQGAPLVPLADVMLFGHEQRGRWLLNIGGMANVTWVPRRGMAEGAFAFDTGPGVAVIDAITRRIDPEATFDENGERARRGKPMKKLLEELLADPYFEQPPPKSTGRERFGIAYADTLLARVKKAGGSDNDAIATATALTAETIGRAILKFGEGGRGKRRLLRSSSPVAARRIPRSSSGWRRRSSLAPSCSSIRSSSTAKRKRRSRLRFSGFRRCRGSREISLRRRARGGPGSWDTSRQLEREVSLCRNRLQSPR
jgi:hypothetical protein